MGINNVECLNEQTAHLAEQARYGKWMLGLGVVQVGLTVALLVILLVS